MRTRFTHHAAKEGKSLIWIERLAHTVTMLSAPAYFVYAYIVLPLVTKSLTVLYASRYHVCPLVKCLRPLIRCVREEECQDWLMSVQECLDPNSEARKFSFQTFSHVQHPQDPAFCRYQCFDNLTTYTALDFLECIGASGCLEPSPYSDQCAVVSEALPFATIPSTLLEGRWKKLFSTGWDIWPCQWTEFHPPLRLIQPNKKTPPPPEPEAWMTEWPHHPGVWRMDLYWKNKNMTFHMCNEMYPGQEWDFCPLEQPSSPANATLKTKAVMWNTEAHENWHLLDYDAKNEILLIYYCAYTGDVRRFDSMAMVLQKWGQPTPLTEDLERTIREKALTILGEKHGRLQKIKNECSSN